MPLTIEPVHYSILIADDDEASRESVRDIVEPEGFHTVLAGSGEQALEIVRGEPVHLLLCDMYMPTLSGLETLQIIRQMNAVLPCILMSGDVNDQLMRQALLAKVYSVVAKPVSKNLLLYLIGQAISRFYESNP